MNENFILRGLGVLVLLAGVIIEVMSFLLKWREKNLLRILYKIKSDETNLYTSDITLVVDKSELALQQDSGPLPESSNYPLIKLGNYSRGIELVSTKTLYGE